MVSKKSHVLISSGIEWNLQTISWHLNVTRTSAEQAKTKPEALAFVGVSLKHSKQTAVLGDKKTVLVAIIRIMMHKPPCVQIKNIS